MKTITALLLCYAFNSNKAPAQILRTNTALPYIGLNAYSKIFTDPFSFTGNQAALASVKQTGIGIYGERRFMLSANSTYCLVAVIPTRLGNIGVQFNYAGFKNFNENKIGIAYARSLGAAIDIGIQFNYYANRIPSYGAVSTVNVEIGAIMHLSAKLQVGIHTYNPVGGRLGKKTKEKLATVYKAGVGYDASDHFFVSAVISKEEDKPVNVIAGIRYQFANVFFVNAGISSESTLFFAGAGLSWKKMRLDISVSHHPQLGFSPGILLITNFQHTKK